MARSFGAGVLGVVHGVADQPGHVLVLQPVEHLRPLPSGAHQPGHSQLGQVLRDRRRRLTDPGGQLIDRQLLIDQRPQQAYPGCVRKHPEHLYSELGLLDWQPIRLSPICLSAICMHTQIVSQTDVCPIPRGVKPAEAGPIALGRCRGLAVGVGRTSRVHEGQPQPWAWLRLPDAAAFFWVAQSAVERLRPGETSHGQDGLWLPLHLPTEAPGSVMIQEVRAQIETIGNEIREAIDQAIDELDPVAPDIEKFVTAVLGMPPIEPADLLDDSSTRLADIELILLQAARSFFDGKINPSRGDDDYLLNRYIRVETLDTHISPSIGRKTRPAGNRPQPWAWLRVHEDTSHAEIAYEGLEQLAPGEVVVDRHGRAIPLEIPTGETGPKMLEAVRDQIHQAMVGIRAAIRTGHASDLEA